VGENAITLTNHLNCLNLQATLDSVNTTISSVHLLMNQIQSPQGSLGLLMRDPGLYNNMNHTVQSADSLVTDLKANPKRYVHFSIFGKKK
jgi:phospholipid/cholesterol/gamma-HCH transport system substrate-binding protein